MSVATDTPPSVFIPDRARRVDGAVSGRGRQGRAHLRLVSNGPRPTAPVTEPSSRGGETRLALTPSSRPSKASPLPLPLPLPQPRPLRLTRRGKVAAVLAVALLGGLLLLVAHWSAPSAATPSRAAQSGVVTVEPGDTLWSIAQQIAPQRDPRVVVAQLRADNQLTDVSLAPGQTLRVG